MWNLEGQKHAGSEWRIRFRIHGSGAKDTDTCRITAYAIVTSRYSYYFLTRTFFSWKIKRDIPVSYVYYTIFKCSYDLIILLMVRRSEVGPAGEGGRFPAPDLGPVQLECHPLPSKPVAILKVIQSIFNFVFFLSFKHNYLLKGSVSEPDSLILDPVF